LWGCTDGDRAEVLGVHEVADTDGVALVGLVGLLLEHLVDATLWTDAHVLLAEVLDLLLNAVALELLGKWDLLEPVAIG
jgi:hypothetical protein